MSNIQPGYHYFYGNPIWLLRMLAQNRPDGVRGWIRALALVAGSFWRWPGMWFEKKFLSKKIWQQEITPAPLFILGQARSGTTLLFKLLCSHPKWVYLDGTGMYFPFLPPALRRLIAPPLQKFLQWLGVKKPHFHNYPLRLSDPVEEDMHFCFCLSPYSAYWGIVCSKKAEALINSTINFANPDDKEKWKAAYLYGIKRLAYYHPGRRIVLKSPPSTGRVAALLEIFPDARFVHIFRNPAAVFRSLEQLANDVLFARFSIQNVEKPVIRELLLRHHQLLFTNYLRDKQGIPPGHLEEIIYDDLMQHPKVTLKRVFQRLGLEDWTLFETACSAALKAEGHYQPNSKPIPADIQWLVEEHWSESCKYWEALAGSERTQTGP